MSCEPRFGAEALGWVEDDVPRQSRALVKADYPARVFNFFTETRNDINERAEALAAAIDKLATQLLQTPDAGGTDLTTAVARERAGRTILNGLYKAYAELNVLQLWLDRLHVEPTVQAFREGGYQAVGRESLLASLSDVGDPREYTLSGHYGFYVGVSFNEDGEYDKAEFGDGEQNGGWVSGLIAGLISLNNPYSWAAALIIFVGVSIYQREQEEECRRRWEDQRDRFKRAFEALPSKLIRPEDQYEIFSGAVRAIQTDLAEDLVAAQAMLDALEERWRHVFAANAMRIKAARAVLTAAKVEELRAALPGDPATAAIFRTIETLQLITDIRSIAAHVAERHQAFRNADAGFTTLAAHEDLQDAIGAAETQFKAFAEVPALLPLHDLLVRNLEWLAAVRQDVDGAPTASFTPQPLPRPPATTPAVAAIEAARADGAILIDPDLSLFAAPFQDIGGRFCVLRSQDGEVYECSASPDRGSPHRGDFSSATGDPLTDILRHYTDGGYEYDDRETQAEINRASRNIEDRIDSLRAKHAAVRTGFAEWKAKNLVDVRGLTTEIAAARSGDEVRRQAFNAQNEALVSEARAALDSFVQTPTSPERIREALQTAGGKALRLPRLDPSQQIPGAPVMTGVDSVAPGVQARIEREAAKAAADLPEGTPERRTAERALAAARRFEAASAGEIAEALRCDAANVRYAASGVLPQPEFAYVDDAGVLTRGPVPEAGLGGTLLGQVETFQAASAYQSARIAQAGDASQFPPSQIPNVISALAIAKSLLQTANTLFFEGGIAEGRHVQILSIAVLDIALSVTPGIGWAKDVYELATGRSMLTGEELDTVDRAFALLGAVTGGLAGTVKYGRFGLTKAIETVAPTLARYDNLAAARSYLAQVYATLMIDGFQFERGWSRTADFADVPTLVERHLQHGNGRDLDEYLATAKDFAARSASYDFAVKRPNGQWVKWNPYTRQFAVYEGETILTYFETNPGKRLDYFIDQYARGVP